MSPEHLGNAEPFTPITDAWTPSHTPKPRKVLESADLSRSGRDVA